MSTDTGSNGVSEPQTTITLTKEDDWWVAKDEETGVASQGKTRTEALEMLDEAVALHNDEKGESVDTAEKERDVLEDLGLDPDEIEESRQKHDELPDFMR